MLTQLSLGCHANCSSLHSFNWLHYSIVYFARPTQHSTYYLQGRREHNISIWCYNEVASPDKFSNQSICRLRKYLHTFVYRRHQFAELEYCHLSTLALPLIAMRVASGGEGVQWGNWWRLTTFVLGVFGGCSGKWPHQCQSNRRWRILVTPLTCHAPTSPPLPTHTLSVSLHFRRHQSSSKYSATDPHPPERLVFISVMRNNNNKLSKII